MTASVRDITPADEARWRELWQEYLVFYENDLPAAVTDTTWTRLLDPGEKAMFGFVAENDDGAVVGFVNCVLHLNTWTEKTICYLEDLFVDRQARKQGAGKALIDAVRKRGHSDGWHRVYWRTGKTNTRARGLYDTLAEGTDWVTYEISL